MKHTVSNMLFSKTSTHEYDNLCRKDVMGVNDEESK